MESLFRVWIREGGPHGSVSRGLLIWHRIEWVLSNFICSPSLAIVEVFSKVLATSDPHHASFVVVMAVARALRISSRYASNALRQLSISAEKVMALVIFLIIGHPNEKVTRAYQSMFKAIISSGRDSNEDERILMKEQLVDYYIQRSLEGYPGII